MNIRQFVSTIKQNLNSSSLDSNISGEHIYWVGVSQAQLLIKRETDSRKIFKNSALFRQLDCVKMIEVNSSECGPYIPCNTLIRSKEKLPETFLSNFGSMIYVYNITRDKEFKEVSIGKYKNIKLQKYKPRNTKYFWIENDYLYVPDSEAEILLVSGLFTNPSSVEEFNQTGECKKVLDLPFPAPDYMMSSIIELTTNMISMKVRVPADEDGNLNQNDRN